MTKHGRLLKRQNMCSTPPHRYYDRNGNEKENVRETDFIKRTNSLAKEGETSFNASYQAKRTL